MSRKLTKEEAARYISETHGIPLTPRTLDNHAWSGQGPRFFKAGHRRLYDPSDLDCWARAKLGEARTSTSDKSPRIPQGA